MKRKLWTTEDAEKWMDINYARARFNTRLLANDNKPTATGCWEWPDDYNFSIGRHGNFPPHIARAWFKGFLDELYETRIKVTRKCGNPICVTYGHFIFSTDESSHECHFLTHEQILDIRDRWRHGLTVQKLADEFNLPVGVLELIVWCKIYK